MTKEDCFFCRGNRLHWEIRHEYLKADSTLLFAFRA